MFDVADAHDITRHKTGASVRIPALTQDHPKAGRYGKVPHE